MSQFVKFLIQFVENLNQKQKLKHKMI